MAKLLIIDDCPYFRQWACFILEREGHEVLEARDGLAGLQRAVEDAPALILIDDGLTGIDAAAICRGLEDEVATRDVPVLVSTATADSGAHAALREAGADDVWIKSPEANVLCERVGSLLGVFGAVWSNAPSIEMLLAAE